MKRKERSALRVAFALIDVQRITIEQAEITANDVLETIKPLLIGKHVKARLPTALYQITDVSIRFDGRIEMHGLKVTAQGLGSNRWNLGWLTSPSALIDPKKGIAR